MAAAEPTAGTISRIRVENFMCHDNMTVDLIDNVNFITGQNGSGKSAILTALCVAFGAKATQRAANLKAFVKNGCSSCLVAVELKNEGEGAFKPELYGGRIIIERHITGSANSFVMKDWQGKKVATKIEDLKDLVDHFSIDVDNPCIIMSQDKSREFLHTGSAKEKFKFFYKATLLQRLDDLLRSIDNAIVQAYGILQEMKDLLKPLQESRKKIEKDMQFLGQMEEMTGQVSTLKKKLSWAYVYEVDHEIEEQSKELEQLDTRIAKCRQKINKKKEIFAEVEEKQCSAEKLRLQLLIAQENCDNAKAQFNKLREAAKDDFETLQTVEKELQSLEDDVNAANSVVDYFTQHLNGRFFPRRKAIEEGVEKLHKKRKINSGIASQICPEDEVNQLGGEKETSQKLGTQLNCLLQRIEHDRRAVCHGAHELHKKHEKIQKRLLRQETMCNTSATKLDILSKVIEDRKVKFKESRSYCRQQLRLWFQRYLNRKGFIGDIKIDYNLEELSLQVQTPQGNSRTSVNDIRVLSGGERSFSTLSFALALHAMTESPFRAMDEFDVFMDAINRKISLDTVVKFALEQGSQWIFITPHDISMVEANAKVNKQLMAAPRP